MSRQPLLPVKHGSAPGLARSVQKRAIFGCVLFITAYVLVSCCCQTGLVGATGHPTVVGEYDRAAATYDERWAHYTRSTVAFAMERMDPLLRSLPCGESCVVVDVGCGTGALSLALRERYPFWNITCADSCKLMLLEAARKGLKTVFAYAEHLPMASESMDAVVSLSSFHFWHDRAAALREAFRVLRPGGLTLAVDWSGDFASCRLLARYLQLAGYPSEDADVLTLQRGEELLRGAGFSIVPRACATQLLDGVRMRPMGLPIGPRWGMMSLAGTKPRAANPSPGHSRTMPGMASTTERHAAVARGPDAALARPVLDALAHDGDVPLLVKVFDPRCSSCQAFQPTWRELERKTKSITPRINLVPVDVSTSEGFALAKRLGALDAGLPNLQLLLPSSSSSPAAGASGSRSGLAGRNSVAIAVDGGSTAQDVMRQVRSALLRHRSHASVGGRSGTRD